MSTSTTLVAPSGADTLAVSPLQSDQSLKASKALLSHMKKLSLEPAASEKLSLLADEDPEAALAETPITLSIVTKRHIVSKPHLRPSKVYLPHPLHRGENTSICIITADPQRAYKDLIADDAFPAQVRKHVSRVIGFSKLQAKFSQFEAQRALYAAHDIFLADERIINRLPAILGKTFFRTTTKRPIPVVLSLPTKKGPKQPQDRLQPKKAKKTETEQAESVGTPAKVAAEITRAAGAALVSLNPSPQISIHVGSADMSAEALAENVEVLARVVVEKHVPHKWNNVKAIYVKGPQTAALPIWQTDSLWLREGDVLPRAQAAGLLTEGEGVSKKRKARNGGDGEEEEEAQADAAAGAGEDSPLPKKVKRGDGAEKKKSKAVAKVLDNSDDAQLDKQVTDRKNKLKQQKAAARKALEV